MPTTSPPADKYTHTLLTVKSLYDSYVAPTLPQPVATVLDTLFAGAVQAQPYITQLTSLFTSLITTMSGSSGGSAESMALLSTAIMILTLYISLRLFNYVRRMVMGWIIFAIKFVLVVVAVQLAFYINRYGWENAIRDASWWGGIVWGLVEDVLEGNSEGGKAPRGTRSRAGTKRDGRYGQQGRARGGAGGGRTRWT